MLPNAIIIGAMKAATTSLHYYLGLHPEIEMSRRKELEFFIEHHNWSRGLAWYEAQFRGGTPCAAKHRPGTRIIRISQVYPRACTPSSPMRS
jgi:hypothetical protein